jgi:signal peptidase I
VAATIEPPRPRAASRATRVILLVGSAVLALLVIGGIAAGLALRSAGVGPGTRTVHVIGAAMEPAVHDGDYLVIQPFAAGGPRAGDIVVMRDPFDHSREFVKRVVALPTQTVSIRDGRLVVDGAAQTEPYLDPRQPRTVLANWPADGQPVTLGGDEYLVLGDNRDHSADSRTFGPVPRADILGRATRILTPSNHARAL